jgi:hypothetical protein
MISAALGDALRCPSASSCEAEATGHLLGRPVWWSARAPVPRLTDEPARFVDAIALSILERVADDASQRLKLAPRAWLTQSRPERGPDASNADEAEGDR